MKWWDISFCISSSVKDWRESWNGMCPSPNRYRVWNSFFFALTWTIWESRNSVVFRGKAASLFNAVDSVRFRIVWWFKNFGRGFKDDITLLLLDVKERCVDSKPDKVTTKSVWAPPLIDDLTFNVDGSTIGNPGMAGIRGVLRDASGKILCLFSSSIEITDPISSEVIAIQRACNLIIFNQLLADRNITIISDSKAAVSWVNGEGFGSLKLVNVVYVIRQTLHLLTMLSVSFMPRSSNSLADSLAKASSGLHRERLK
ncbi:hypothetical protein Dsin_012891 [Dipteronia sinensis]|uniref:RNase H type-1 domain-containing protein n=1 Tax=Dipteronia sinensis TaxID=43782 RepID=A0AAE0AIW3_9ROSI|nr:hypothetical protein Dsin_012891 [Dipteronia sinensis]